MKKQKLWLAALLLIVLANIVILAGVYLNRSSEPTTELLLSERELSIVRVKESQSLSLRLKSDAYPAKRGGRNPDWLDKQHLTELGFDVEEQLVAREQRKTPKEKLLYLVLELEGPHYQKWVEEMQQELVALESDPEENKRKITRLKQQLNYQSRLVAVDAGLDAEKLREAYPDKHQYLIAKAIVANNVRYKDGAPNNVIGWIKQLSVEKLHVPLPLKRELNGLKGRNWSEQHLPPRFEAKVAYGSRYEPWVMDIKRLDGGPEQ